MGEEKYQLTPKDMSFVNRPTRYVDRTFIDKLTAFENLKRMEEIHKEGIHNKSQLQEMLHLLTAIEPKFLNFSDWDRIAASLFFTRVRSYVKIGINAYAVKEVFAKSKVTERAKQIFGQVFDIIHENMMYIIDVFLYVTRTSLSVSGYAFGKLADNQFDLPYEQQQQKGFPLWPFGGQK